MIELEFDGLFRASRVSLTSGIMGVGWLVWERENLLAKGYAVIARGRDATSNIAEYLAMIEGLQALIDMQIGNLPVRVTGDSRVVLDQMSGCCKVNAERLISIYRRACKLAAKLNIVDYHWIPRRFNRSADLLSRKALRDLRSDNKEFQSAWEIIARDFRANRRRLRPLLGVDMYNNIPVGVDA